MTKPGAVKDTISRGLDGGTIAYFGHRAAWGWAEKATTALGEIVGAHLPLGDVLRASLEQLRTG